MTIFTKRGSPPSGNWRTKLRENIKLFLMLFLLGSFVSANQVYGQGSVTNNSQWGKNGPADAPLTTGLNWANGNAQGTNSHFQEGQSAPTRIEIEGLTPGVPASVTFNINITQGTDGQHAFDFFTGPNRINELVDPLSGLSGYGPPSYFTFPVPDNTNTGGVPASYYDQTAPKMACQQAADAGDPTKNSIWIYNGTVSSITYVWGNEDALNTEHTYCTVTYTPTSTKVVLAIGCHIAAEGIINGCAGWGVGNGATAISGSPYHFHIDQLCQPLATCVVQGSQDQQMASSAVCTPPTVVITGDNTICSGESTTLTATPTPAGTYTYQWSTVSGGVATPIAGETNATLTVSPTATTTYRVAVHTGMNGGCEGIQDYLVTVNSVTAGTIGSDQTVCALADIVAFTEVTPATGSGTLSYQWQKAATCEGPFTDIEGATSATYTATEAGAYRRVATSTLNGVPCAANSNCVVITVNNVTAGTIGSDQTVCALADIVAFTEVTPATGSGTLSYQWQKAATCEGPFTDIEGATSATYTATEAGAYRRVATSTLNGVPCAANSNCVVITVNNVTAGTIGSDQTVCSVEDIVAFTEVTPATGSGTLSYQWQKAATCEGPFTDIEGATSATYTATEAGAYRRVTTSTLNGVPCAANSNCVVITVNDVTAGTIGSDQTVCSVEDIVAFTEVTPATGSGTLSYQWQKAATCEGPFTDIEGATSATYTATEAGAYRRVTTSTLNDVPCAANSNCVVITVNDVTAGTIGSDQTVCALADIVAFTEVTPATGSGTLSYQWQKAATCEGPFTDIEGATSATYTATEAGAYRRVATSTLNGVPCAANSNCVVITVNDVTAGTIGSDQTVCSVDDIVAFTEVTPATGSGTLSYQWQKAATCEGPFTDIEGATSATYTATEAGAYRRVTTSTLNGVPCAANSNCVTITQQGVTAGTIGSDQTVCALADIVAFTEVTPATGSGTLSYQWQKAATCAGPFTDIEGATSATYTATEAGAYRRVATSTLNGVPCAANSNCVVITVNDVTAGTIGSDQTVCSVEDIVAFTEVTPATGSGTLSYQWQKAATCEGPFTDIEGATSTTYTATEAGAYRRVTTSTLNGVPCAANSNCVTITQQGVTAGTIGSDQTVCALADIVAFTEVTPATGSGTLSYQWQKAATCEGPFTDIEGATSATYTATEAGAYRRVATSTLNGVPCAANSNCVVITVNDVTAGTIGSDQSICVGETIASFTEVTPATGSGTLSYQWQKAATCEGPFTDIEGATSATYTATEAGAYRRVATSTLNGVPCAANSNCVVITVNPLPVISCSATGPIDITSAAHSSQLDVSFAGSDDTDPTHYTYEWTEDGAGSLSSLDIKDPVYTAALGDAGGTVHFTITVKNTITGCSQTSNCEVNVNTVGTCSVTGPTPVCSGSTNTYTSPLLANEASRVWTVSAIPSGATDATISGADNGVSVDVVAGSTAYRVTLTITFLNQEITTSCWEDVTVSTCGSNCTYTQGYYGNKNGNSCDADGTGSGPITYQSPVELLTTLLSTDLTVGVGDVSITVPAGSAGAIKLNSVMPGGKTPTELTNTSNCVITNACFNSYLTKGKINNVLLSQTITLGLNMRISSSLSGFEIKAGTLVTADPVGGCGSITPKERVCVYKTTAPYNLISDGYAYNTIKQSVINALDCKGYAHTVAGLYALANDALANVEASKAIGTECGASLSDINNAVDAINKAFDGCKIFIGWDVPTTCAPYNPPITIVAARSGGTSTSSTALESTVTQLSVSTYPNPYIDRIRFEIKSPVSGQATLEVYNTLGQKMKTVYKGFIFANRGERVDYNVPALQRTNLFYTLRVGGKQVTGKLINLSR